MGTAGNNSWEGNRRLATGGAAPRPRRRWRAAVSECLVPPAARGELFTIYRSDDGQEWTQLGTTTFTEAMPAKLYVGPEFSPENGNIAEDSGLRGVWVAKFRDYGTYNPVTTPTVGITAAGVITYTGVLQSSATVNGTLLSGRRGSQSIHGTQDRCGHVLAPPAGRMGKAGSIACR